ncbi:uncharacterized protein LOC126844478 [Adelges cooleyi]|uniref:uncharacterized protein LOC126844478 n=1 Tax=Adelges cooleyi TaxID=133065 RepID=UPI00217FDEC3|nr:uncharacterized protein LOC126844478 [Adelges cooleyi]
MSDTDSIKTDRSQTDLQQKYDKLAMEFAKVRMQLNVLKKAYTSKVSKSDKRSIDSLDQLEGCKYDTMSTNSLELQDDYNKLNQNHSKLKGVEEVKSKDFLLLKQDVSSMNHCIQRVLEITKPDKIDYNVIMSEIEYCKNVQTKYPSKYCDILNNELSSLKNSVNTCLQNILYYKLESRTKVNADDVRLNYPHHYCLENDYKLDENRWKKVFVTLVIHFFCSFVEDFHRLLEYLLKDLNTKALTSIQKNVESLLNQSNTDSLILEKIKIYCNDLKKITFTGENTLMENIISFMSNKYMDFVECVKNLIKSDNTNDVLDCGSLRQSIISLMVLKFPIKELTSNEELWNAKDITHKLNVIYNTAHTLLRAINILEFEYFYTNSQMDMHWHLKNLLLHANISKEAKKDLTSPLIANECFEKALKIYNDKLNEEMDKSKQLENEKIHWETEYKLLQQKYEKVTISAHDVGSNGLFTIENQLGKLESSVQLSDEIIARENETKMYFENKINELVHVNKQLSGQSNTQKMEISALRTKLDHSVLVRSKLEVKLQDALEQIQELKEEFHLTTTNYEAQLRALTEHLASLNETVILERKHIDDLNCQLKTKGDKKKPSK